MSWKVVCSDCVDHMRTMPDNIVDLTVTSPPYDRLRRYGGDEAILDYAKFERVSGELFRVTKEGGVVVWVAGDQTVDGGETGTSFRQALGFMEAGFKLYDTMIYQKANYIPLTHNRYEQSFEYMFVFSKGKPKTFNPIMVPCKGAGKLESYGTERRGLLDKNQAMRSPEGKTYKKTKPEKIHPNVFTYSCGASRSGHPAVFPDMLAEDMVASWSNVGDLVLDPFCGSGTTGAMSVSCGRSFVGIDVNEDYCAMAAERIGAAEDEFMETLWSIGMERT